MSIDLSSNYFELFHLPESFVVDSGKLTEQYRELQQKVHPDRFASASEQERRLSMQLATRINEAFRVLKDPLERARYLLQVKGVEWEDEQSTVNDTAFLMEQMELREALGEVREQPDPLDAVADILDDVAKRVRAMTNILEQQLQQEDLAVLEEARQNVRKMQFLYKLRSEAESLEADLEDEV
jgi:molecular chaperone HscB